MNTSKAYYVGTHKDGFRAGEPAEIIGVVSAQPSEMMDWRPCFCVKYDDRVTDYHPINDTGNYTIINFNDILKGNVPKVNY